MKKTFLASILAIACLGINAQVQCWNDSTGLIPLNDLGTGYYNGMQGGLYLSGTNIMPLSHKKKGNNYSKQFKPLDSFGNINYEEGEILMLAFGASIASNAINAFGDSLVTYDFEGVSNCVSIKSMCFGGKDLDYMIDTASDNYWDGVRNRMADRGDTYAQVQIAWLMQQSDGDSTDDFLTYFNSVSAKYVTLLQMMKDSFPNLKQIFISGMHYTGYMDPNHDRYPSFSNPHDYWGNLVIRDLIVRQISGDPALKYKGIAPAVPWLAWGPYFWADGVNPRQTDLLSWKCEQFRTDLTGGGFHLINEPESLGVEAHMLLNFFETNPVAKTWYLDGILWAGCPEDTTRKENENLPLPQKSLLVYPNPAHNDVLIKLPELIQGEFTVEILDEIGRTVTFDRYSNYNTVSIPMSINLTKGLYFISVISSTEKLITKFIVQ